MLHQVKFQISLKTHRENEVFCIHFDKHEESIEEVKKIGGSWSNTMQCWYVAATRENFDLLISTLRPYGYVDYRGLRPSKLPQEKKMAHKAQTVINSDEKLRALQRFEQWLHSKRYSDNTVKVYSESIKIFLNFFDDKAISEIHNEDLIRFNNEYILHKKLSASYQNQVVNGVKLFFRQIEHKALDVDLIHRPKNYNPLPKVLSAEDVTLIINALDNIKHKCMLSLIYSAGLRRSELLHLKVQDIDSKRMLVYVRNAKGRKDRVVPLSQTLLPMLREYYLKHKPKKYLFEGQSGDMYTARSLALVLKSAVEKAGIRKKVTLHMLRHSYATHLLENGTAIRYIQELLGHKSSKTTEIYTHVSRTAIQKIGSPLDQLPIKIKGNSKP